MAKLSRGLYVWDEKDERDRERPGNGRFRRRSRELSRSNRSRRRPRPARSPLCPLPPSQPLSITFFFNDTLIILSRLPTFHDQIAHQRGFIPSIEYFSNVRQPTSSTRPRDVPTDPFLLSPPPLLPHSPPSKLLPVVRVRVSPLFTVFSSVRIERFLFPHFIIPSSTAKGGWGGI